MKKKYKHIEEDIRIIRNSLAQHPQSGKVIKGSGGVRKIRMAIKGKNAGKSGGIRFFYLYEKQGAIAFIDLLDKSDAENLSDQRIGELYQEAQRLLKDEDNV